jgi:hypothetical protein
MLFAARFHDGLRRGTLDLTFRRWRAPRVRVGAVYRIASDAAIRVKSVTPAKRISVAEARRAGFDSPAALRRYLTPVQRGDGRRLYRIEFERAEVPRNERAALSVQRDDALTLAALMQRLDGMDRRSAAGAWTGRVLALIGAQPGCRAAELATRMGWETLTFKAHVRRLKALGLTESLEVGYRLSPRGRRLLDALSC